MVISYKGGIVIGNKRVCSDKDDWGTPLPFFRDLDKEFAFTLDPCGWKERPLKGNIITLDIRNNENGLLYNWKDHSVFANPPYSGTNIKRWIKKCFSERNNARTIVLLIPPNTDTDCFHEFVIPFATIRFVRGRISFIDRTTGRKKTGNPQGSILCIFKRKVQ